MAEWSLTHRGNDKIADAINVFTVRGVLHVACCMLHVCVVMPEWVHFTVYSYFMDYLNSRHTNGWLQWMGQRQLQDETRNISVLGFDATYSRGLTVCIPPMLSTHLSVTVPAQGVILLKNITLNIPGSKCTGPLLLKTINITPNMGMWLHTLKGKGQNYVSFHTL